MKNEEIKINIDTEQKEVTVLTGQASEPQRTYLEAIKIEGTFDAPSNFLKDKKDNYTPAQCHVTIDRVKGIIAFHGDDKKHNKDVITGKLSVAAALVAFCINADKTWRTTDLAKFFRMNKFHFENPAQQEALVASLTNFSAKVSSSIVQNSNNDGNAQIGFERQVSGIAWDRVFKLNMPIFEGYEKKTFRVEVGVDPSDRSVHFFLESDELWELFDAYKAEIIAQEVAKFTEFGCSIVYLT